MEQNRISRVLFLNRLHLRQSVMSSKKEQLISIVQVLSEKIEAALTKVEEGKLNANYGVVSGTYMTELRYVCDFGPTQFEEVRRAIGYIVDRDELDKQLTGGYGSVLDCYATEATKSLYGCKG